MLPALSCFRQHAPGTRTATRCVLGVSLVLAVAAPAIAQPAHPAPAGGACDDALPIHCQGPDTRLRASAANPTAPAGDSTDDPPKPGSGQEPGGAAPDGEDPGDPAQEAPPPSAEQLDELRRKIDVLAQEVEQLRSGEEQEVELPDRRRESLGLAPSAASTYRKKRGVSVAGYGEMLYEDPGEENQGGEAGGNAQLDYLRLILYTGYRFSDRVLFNSEVEFEHANEVSVEFAYLDFLLNDYVGVRGGMVLVPLGLVNEFHEPTVFLGAKRPETETRIIPSTWRENGVGVLGSVGQLNYRAYLVSGLNALGFGPQGLRGGRQRGSRSRIEDAAVAFRADYAPANGVLVGGALFRGGADQDQFVLNGRQLDVTTTIFEVHGQALLRGFDVRGLVAQADVDDAAALSAARNLPRAQSVAPKMTGGYVQAGYNLLSQFTDRFWLTPYYRFEKVNTQQDVEPPFVPDPSQDGTWHTVGAEFRPIYSVVVKADYQWIRNKARTGRNQFNINLGYAF